MGCSVPPPAHGITCQTCSRHIPPLLLDAAAQTPSHGVASADATTQLPLTEFFLECIYSNDPMDRSVPPPTHGNASSASLPQPADIATIFSPSSTSRTRWTPPALPQVTFCQLRSLRLPRTLLCCIPGALHLCSCFPPPQLPVPTPPLDAATQTSPHTAASQDVSTQPPPREILASPSTLHVRCPTCARPVPSLPLDAAVQTPLHSVATHDASTQLPLTEFFIGCILSNDPLDRQALPSAHCNAGSASPPLPADIATLCSPSSASHASDGHEHTTAPLVLLQPPPGLGKYARQYASHGKPVKAAPVRPRRCTSISVTLPQPHVCTTQVGTHPVRSATTYKGSASTALSGTHNPVGADPRAGTRPFPKPRALVLPIVKFGQSKLDGLGYIDTVDSDLMHHQYRLSVLQWNPGQARRNPNQYYCGGLWEVPCGYFSRSQ